MQYEDLIADAIELVMARDVSDELFPIAVSDTARLMAHDWSE